MNKYIKILVLIVVAKAGFGQQQAVMSNFLMSDYYYNPAIAGSKKVTMANMAYRSQWTGFENAPETLLGSVYGSIKNKGVMGYGVSVISDRTGLTQNTGFYLNYAHHFKLNDDIKLGFGVQPGYLQYRVKLYDAQLADQGDDVLTGNILSSNAIDLHSGFNLYSEKFFVMGSVQHLLGKNFTLTPYNSSLSKHFTMIGGYNFNVEGKDLVIQPSLMLKYSSPVPIQYTAMVKGTYQGKYWAGLTFRSQDAAGICLGYKLLDRLNIGYGYDYSLSGIRQYQSGSHEIVFSFVMTPNRPTLDDQDDKLNNSIMEEMQKKMKEKKK